MYSSILYSEEKEQDKPLSIYRFRPRGSRQLNDLDPDLLFRDLVPVHGGDEGASRRSTFSEKKGCWTYSSPTASQSQKVKRVTSTRTTTPPEEIWTVSLTILESSRYLTCKSSSDGTSHTLTLSATLDLVLEMGWGWETTGTELMTREKMYICSRNL